MNRTWNELDSAMKLILAKVVLRLKGILERNGRVVKPYLFQVTCGRPTLARTPQREIFTLSTLPPSIYGHNEMENGISRVNHHQMEDRRNSKEYAKHFERSEPVEEWDDRLKLYGVKIKPLYPAAVVTGRKKIRHQNLEDLMELI
ncbi:uncharacterized protein PADG_03617 [Paracoccidioides brasiliensis Pb18]|uniref:Uncharacterized protein n=1 Tax=Paracoccidioides brasiliensis (strain Pb18) TaxID=502780 RepID=C1G8N1_PARBD|nr:uncharacterized protein PADG_03617 [Paracoccidioides brasiliensis Pb18]EEH47533.2 hypothetical protein PADG_03617 [Paracoccidioides brasiliensis Pb18]